MMTCIDIRDKYVKRPFTQQVGADTDFPTPKKALTAPRCAGDDK